jgi:hypothetical protein
MASSNTQDSAQVVLTMEQYQQLLRNQQSRTDSIEPVHPGSSTVATGNMAVYASENLQTKTAFFATAPAGNRHSKLLTQLTASVQGQSISYPEEAPQRRRKIEGGNKRSGRRLINDGTQSEASTVDSSRTVATPTVSRYSEFEDRWELEKTGEGAIDYLAKKMERGLQFQRFETETDIVYLRNTKTGKVYVSVPKNSPEAAMYDSIAQPSGLRRGQVHLSKLHDRIANDCNRRSK